MDNLLFHSDSLADILDFDRLHYVYMDFDISRSPFRNIASKSKKY